MYNDNTNTTDDTPEMAAMKRRLEYKRRAAETAKQATAALRRQTLGDFTWDQYRAGIHPPTPHH